MSSWREELRAQFRLAGPVVLVQVGLMAMGVVDTLMMGRVSDVHMAAVAIGHTWSFGMIAFGLGVLQALDPIVSQAFGARDRTAISRGMQRGILLSMLLSVPIAALILPARPALELLGQSGEIVPIATDYALISIAGVPAFLLFVALRQGLQAMHRMRPLVLTILCANLLNVALDWALIFGHAGFPALGAVGCSWATVLSRWCQALAVLAFAWPLLRPHLLPIRRETFALRPLLTMLGLGTPIGLQFAVEIGAFSVVALLMGRLGPGEIAGHQVALNLAALSFMVPLGIGIAASVRVGNEIGRGDPAAARRAAKVALVCGPGFMAFTALLYLLLPEPLARAYTDDSGVIAVAVALIPLAGVFQVFDGIQVVCGGVLRGAGDTRIPMVVHLVGFWLFGIPLGWILAFERDLGPQGLWWGLVAGLASVALVLLARVRIRMRRTLERLAIDGEETGALADPERVA